MADPDGCPKPGADRITQASPVRPGISVGLEGRDAGTLGLFVVDHAGDLCILTARHLLGRKDSRGKPIVQPANEDGGGQTIARVTWLNKRSDGALARVEPGFDCAIEQMGSGGIVQTFRAPRLNDLLTKSGRTTGTTHARVIEVATNVGRLKKVFILERLEGDDEPISCPGDSGAIWYDALTNEGVGLHHTGHVDDGTAVAVPLPYIVSAYERLHDEPFHPWDGTFLDD